MATLAGVNSDTLSLWDRIQSKWPTAQLTSGYRSPDYNASIGGARNSAHTHGNAIDFVVPGMTSEQLSSQIAQNFDYGKLITYPGQRNVHLEPGSAGTNLLKTAGGYALNKGIDAVKKAGNSIIDGITGKTAGDTLSKTIDHIPGGSVVKGLTGIGGDSWLTQLKNWISNSGFFVRIGMAFLAFIILLMAFYLLGTGQVQRSITKVVKG